MDLGRWKDLMGDRGHTYEGVTLLVTRLAAHREWQRSQTRFRESDFRKY